MSSHDNQEPNEAVASGSPYDDEEKMHKLDFKTRHFLYMIRRIIPRSKMLDRSPEDIETEAYNIGVRLSDMRKKEIKKVPSQKATGLDALFNDMHTQLQMVAPIDRK